MPVTVPGSPPSGPSVTLSTGSGDVLQLAQQISNILNAANNANTLNVYSVSGSGSLPDPGYVGPGTTTELLIGSSSQVNSAIPTGYDYVLPVGPGAVSLTGSDVKILSGSIGGAFDVSGTSTVAAIGGSNTVDASGNYAVSFGAGTNLVLADGSGTVATGAGTTTVVASNESGAGNLIESSGLGDFVSLNDGLNTVAAYGGNVGILGGTGSFLAQIFGSGATISTAQANASVSTSGDNGVVFGGIGTLQFDDSGGIGNTIVGGAGNASVLADGTGDVILGGAGTLNATLSGANDTVATNAAAATISATTHDAAVFGGSGAITFVNGTGTSSVLGGFGGSEQIAAGAGGVLFSANQSNTGLVIGGTGESTIFGGANSLVDYNSSLGGAILVASGGNETLNAAASSTAVTLSGGAIPGSNADLIGGSGPNQLFAGTGSDTFTGGGSSDTFGFFSSATSGGQDAITDFNASDTLYLVGYDSTRSSVGANASGQVTLTLSDSTTITFTNLTNTSALNGHYLYVNR